MDRRTFNKLAGFVGVGALTGNGSLAELQALLPVSKGAASEKYLALPLTESAGKATSPKILERYGVPFVEGTLQLLTKGSGRVEVGCPVKRIFLLGMTESAFIGCWADPTHYSVRYFIGDRVGQIRLDYADRTMEVLPLILGESIWWGQPFYRSPGPFPTDAHFRRALASALRLYPPAPVREGNYVAVIAPKPVALRSVTISGSLVKQGTPRVAGMTVELEEAHDIAGAMAVSPGAFPPEFKNFVHSRPLRLLGEDERQTQPQLNDLRRALYSSNRTFFHSQVAAETPHGYTGPEVSFKGGAIAKIISNAFEFNVQDMADKIDSNGMYHTSTKGALLWGYNGGQLGTYTTNVGLYYGQSWSRDMGRSLQELTMLGYTNDAQRCADYCLRTARLWEGKSAPKIHGEFYPPHWSRIANEPGAAPPYENDGHGLITLFLYKLWQRLPDRGRWLRSRWPDVKAAGDWILWQFAHPEISGATNGVLHTTGECAGGSGYSVYADCVCMDALDALTQMADSIGKTNSAAQWRVRAEKMRKAVTARYIVTDPKYGRVWTLVDAGWPNKSTVLGPLIFQADYQGFAPEDGEPEWRPVNEATYQRLIDTYQPFGFYGWAMGYGQGFVTQAALLLDRMHDATRMLDWAAKEIYDPRFDSFIVPEGVQIDPRGRFWYRAGDLGNGVQEAEIVKALRLVVGVDDTQPNRLRLFPRMPYDWNEIEVKKYPVLFASAGGMDTTSLHYRLERSGNRMELEVSSDKELGPVAIRLGPFEKRVDASNVRINGKHPTASTVDRSGDSWWIRFTTAVVPLAGVVK